MPFEKKEKSFYHCYRSKTHTHLHTYTHEHRILVFPDIDISMFLTSGLEVTLGYWKHTGAGID